jgi:hypothetical protein
MTELPTLQAALRETAERTYPRRRRRAVLVPALMAAAALALAVLVIDNDRRPQPGAEVTATPTAVFTPTPLPTPSPPSGLRRLDAKELRPTPVDPHDPSLERATSLLRQGTVVVKAWYVPGLQGHVLLTRKNGRYCLSAPYPLSEHPDVQRSTRCASPQRRAKRGDTARTGNVAITLPPGADTPEIRQR